MPQKNERTGFSLDGALKAHARDETNYRQDYTDLPGGIVNGEAEMVAASLGEYKTGDNKGKKFVRLAASVLTPLEHPDVKKRWVNDGTKNGRVEIVSSSVMKTRGLQTSVMLPLCDTKNATAEENVAMMLNELRTIGGADFTEDIESEDDLVAKLQQLVDADPPIRIKFGTSDPEPSREYPNSRSFPRWYGAISPNGDASTAATTGPAAAAVADGTGGAGFNEFSNEQLQESPADDDWDAWVGRYDGAEDPSHTRDEAVEKLKAMAMAAGVEESAVDDAADWAEVKELMDAVTANSDDQPAPWEPAEGEPAKLSVQKDPKDKKKGVKKVDVVVVKIDTKKGMVTVRDAATKKVMMDGKNPKLFKLGELSED